MKGASKVNYGFLNLVDCRRVRPCQVKRGFDTAVDDLPDFSLFCGDVQVPGVEVLELRGLAAVVQLLEGEVGYGIEGPGVFHRLVLNKIPLFRYFLVPFPWV